jgi:hypothetical protein
VALWRNETNVIASLAEACECSGAITDALEAVDRALQASPDEVVFRPHILRLRGDLRLKCQKSRRIQQSATFGKQSLWPRKMSAKAWELESTMSLTRLIAEQGKREEARTMVADIFNWFTEGLDAADLKEARATLA